MAVQRIGRETQTGRAATPCLFSHPRTSVFVIAALFVFTTVASAASRNYAIVAPPFQKRCVLCHSGQAAPRGLRLDSYGALLLGGQRETVVIPGAPDSNELLRRIEGKSQPRMPFDGPPYLSHDEIRLISDWIAVGAPDDAGNRAPLPAGAAVRFRGAFASPV
jgi:hypothetical protein